MGQVCHGGHSRDIWAQPVSVSGGSLLFSPVFWGEKLLNTTHLPWRVSTRLPPGSVAEGSQCVRTGSS